MIKCQISIKTPQGEQSYCGVFKTTIDAVLDALNRVCDSFPRNVSVEVIR